ncbi:MAG: ATP-dependent Clp protease proteolytic subunit [Bacilli bacterium]|nr:ATP-dependent Clp protease proteolytic subunit [Bacilli bacterium]MDD4795781.1 ATP-dependent Clp protease proteolytic subunit [Bacilli bacterium]
MNNKKNSKKQKFKEKPSDIELLDKRIIYLTEEIEEKSSQEIIEQLLKLDESNNRDITMYINSGGGSVSAGLAIYDVMNMIKSDVKTIGIGRCASMASVLLINGTKGKRFILPNAEVMIHEVSSSTYGKVTEMQDKLDHSKSLNRKLRRIIVEKTNKTSKQVEKETHKRDSWLNANEALKWGFVDKIIK